MERISDLVHRLRRIGEVPAAGRIELLERRVDAPIAAVEKLPSVQIMLHSRGTEAFISRAAVLEILRAASPRDR